MTYPFVAAKWYTAGGMKQPRAVVVHMAEGGGTVSWLTHPSGDNSSHFVIEYTGRVVQMVKDADASHSLHIDRPYGPPGTGDFGTYSLDVAKAVLGTGIADPNAYIFAVEIEGFASAGPNAAQVNSLKALIADLRARHPSIAGNLGHRDFQDYKPCPGGKIPWATLGGHGRFVEEADEVKIEFKVERWTLDGGGKVTTLGAPYKADGTTVDYSQRLAYLSDAGGANPRLDFLARTRLTLPDASQDAAFKSALAAYAFPPAPLPDCSAEVLNARAIEYARVTGGATIAFPEPPV